MLGSTLVSDAQFSIIIGHLTSCMACFYIKPLSFKPQIDENVCRMEGSAFFLLIVSFIHREKSSDASNNNIQILRSINERSIMPLYKYRSYHHPKIRLVSKHCKLDIYVYLTTQLKKHELQKVRSPSLVGLSSSLASFLCHT